MKAQDLFPWAAASGPLQSGSQKIQVVWGFLLAAWLEGDADTQPGSPEQERLMINLGYVHVQKEPHNDTKCNSVADVSIFIRDGRMHGDLGKDGNI